MQLNPHIFARSCTCCACLPAGERAAGAAQRAPALPGAAAGALQGAAARGGRAAGLGAGLVGESYTTAADTAEHLYGRAADTAQQVVGGAQQAVGGAADTARAGAGVLSTCQLCLPVLPALVLCLCSCLGSGNCALRRLAVAAKLPDAQWLLRILAKAARSSMCSACIPLLSCADRASDAAAGAEQAAEEKAASLVGVAQVCSREGKEGRSSTAQHRTAQRVNFASFKFEVHQQLCPRLLFIRRCLPTHPRPPFSLSAGRC